MTIFYILYFLLTSFCIFANKSRIMGMFLMILLFIILTFRGINVGSDTIMYYTNNFNTNLEFSITNKFEISFQIISYVIYELGVNPRWCLYSLSILTFLFLYLSARRYNRLFGTSYVCFIYFFFLFDFYSLAFNISRQIAAVVILLYGYSFLFENEKKRYFFFIFVLLAASFHISSLIFAPAFWGIKINFCDKSFKMVFAWLSILFIFVVFSKNTLLAFLTSKFSLFEFYNTYLDDAETSTKSITGILVDYFQFLVSMFVYYWLTKHVSNKYFINLFVLSILIGIIFMAFYGNIGRIRYGIIIFQVVAYATCFTHFISFKNTGKLVFYSEILLHGYFILAALANGAYDIKPYYITF